MTPETFKTLLAGYYAGSLTDQEKLELSVLLHDPQHRNQLEQLFNENFTDPGFKSIADTDLLELMYQQIQLQKQPAPVHRLYSTWTRWVAAAVIFLIAGTGTYFLLFHQSPRQVIVNADMLKTDVTAPASSRAVLQLADGKVIILDSAANGELAIQGNVKLLKTADGQLTYKVSSPLTTKQVPLITNTLTVSRGSRPLQLTLADGTKIWLNSSSSITYPIAFTGPDRKLQMKGEAYYEVSKDTTKKFYVIANRIETEVLGTHFNVNAYEDETTLKVTLLEGSINVSTNGQSAAVNQQRLSPGQQAQWKSGDKIKVFNNANTDEAVAWKDGFFDFNGADIQSVMRQLARWYNVEIEYQGKITDSHFSGIINRNNNVSQVLKMLQTTGSVRFNVESNSASAWAGKIIVLP